MDKNEDFEQCEGSPYLRNEKRFSETYVTFNSSIFKSYAFYFHTRKDIRQQWVWDIFTVNKNLYLGVNNIHISHTVETQFFVQKQY